MEKQCEEITIVRSKDPNELLVYHASSLEDEIRFYINKTQYVTACEEKDGEIFVGLGEDEKNVNKKVKEKLKIRDYLIIGLICLGVFLIVSAIIITSLFIGMFFNSGLVYLVVLNLLLFLFDIVRVVVVELKTTSPRLKSKHSAEHMMVNFLTKNKRLPKNLTEIKESSRFCDECGSRKLIEGITEDFVGKIVSTIVSIIVVTIYDIFFSNVIAEIIVLCAGWFGTFYILKFLFKKVDKLKCLLKPLKRLLTNLAQCANTTKNVKDDDIYLAYYAARTWLIIVYPEHYSLLEDVFLETIKD